MGDSPLLEIKKRRVGGGVHIRMGLDDNGEGMPSHATAKGVTKRRKEKKRGSLSKLRARPDWAGSFISPNTDA